MVSFSNTVHHRSTQRKRLGFRSWRPCELLPLQRPDWLLIIQFERPTGLEKESFLPSLASSICIVCDCPFGYSFVVFTALLIPGLKATCRFDYFFTKWRRFSFFGNENKKLQWYSKWIYGFIGFQLEFAGVCGWVKGRGIDQYVEGKASEPRCCFRFLDTFFSLERCFLFNFDPNSSQWSDLVAASSVWQTIIDRSRIDSSFNPQRPASLGSHMPCTFHLAFFSHLLGSIQPSNY